MTIVAKHLSILSVSILVGCSSVSPENEEDSKSTGATTSPVIGGSNAIPGVWPWQAQLLVGGSHNCGGTILNEKWVLTAAHCVSGLSPSAVTLRLGLHRQSVPDTYVQNRNVDRIVIHPDYLLAPDRDVALLRLSTAATFTERVQPIQIRATDAPVGATATVTGWGWTSGFGDSSDILQQAPLPVRATDVCNNAGTLPRVVSENELCAGYVGGDRGGCHGDSGGPLVVPNASGTGWEQIGIVSWGVGGSCSSYTVFARLSRFSTWIGGIIAPSLELTLGAPKLVLKRGESRTVHVTIARDRVPGPVTVALVNPPPGLTAAPLTLPAGVNEGDLSLTVPQNQPSGSLGTITIRAASGGTAREATLLAVVQGNPGERDTSFGTSGIFQVSKLSNGRFLEVKANGDLLIGGEATSSTSPAIAAVRPDGAVDTAYGTSGVTVQAMGFPLREAGVLGMDSDPYGLTGFLVLEEFETRGDGDVWLGVLQPNGFFSPTFTHESAATKGRRIARNQNGQTPCGVTYESGEFRVATRDVTLNRLDVLAVGYDGDIDIVPGNPVTVLSGLPVTYCGAPLLMSDGVVVPYSLGNGLGLAGQGRPRVERGIGTVAGRVSHDSQKRVTVATSFDRAGARVASFLRLMPTGTLDPVSDFPAQGFVGEARAARGYDDGRALVAGYTIVGGIRKAAVARFNSAGQLDTTFGNAGVVLVRDELAVNTEAVEVALQPEGDIVVLGKAPTGPFLARLWR